MQLSSIKYFTRQVLDLYVYIFVTVEILQDIMKKYFKQFERGDFLQFAKFCSDMDPSLKNFLCHSDLMFAFFASKNLLQQIVEMYKAEPD